ncbi:aspartate aminotransferase family protein [Plastoroseomonas hellenica]|nr:aminotransferase class III-fold pyridoxal phosphate-dependent enzyme [Plastoroseomonas hellenica]
MPHDDAATEGMWAVAMDQQTNSRIVAAFRERTPGSAAFAEQASDLFPSGITHDSRHQYPYGIYVTRAEGPRKWDVDGNAYIDFFGGHGSLLLGHRHPVVAAAVAEAATEGTHYGASHPREIAWGRAVQRLVPAAERLRFTSSGTEATLMAVRLARAFTGKTALLRFRGHFHGWHDHMAGGYSNHFDGTPTPGVLSGVAEQTVLLDANDLVGLRAALAARDDIAAAIIEPTGASFGQVPVEPSFLHALREETTRHGVLLIMDEVVTGFRVARGGAQAALGVTPDLMSFAKILAGGLPGGAVAGREDVLSLLDFGVTAKAGREKIAHQGTYNANPLSAAAGTAALEVIATTDANARANATAATLRQALNAVLAEERVPWAVYGTFSGFHLFMNPEGAVIDPLRFDPLAMPASALKNQPKDLAAKLRLALQIHGVDTNGRIGGVLSSTHGEAEVRGAAGALRAAVRMLRADGEMP